MITALAVFALWFVYGQVVTISENAKTGNLNNQKLFLISEAATNLFTIEGISRDIVQNQNTRELPRLKAQIDTVSVIIDSIKGLSQDLLIRQELDSVNILLEQKAKNIEELLELRRLSTTDSYYAKVISRLQKIDDLFEEEDYEEQLKDFDPATRNAIIGFIRFSENEYANRLTERSADSLVNSLKQVLSELEAQERRMMFTINEKENELLENDRNISAQLRKLRAEIEQDEIRKSVAQVSQSQAMLQRTSLIIGVIGITAILTILVFIILIQRDTNRSQKYRQELETSKNLAESLLKSRNQIMAAVTHDLRSPLNSVIGYADLLQNSDLSIKQSHYLGHLRNSSNYILRLVNDLLDLSKLEAGKISTESLPFEFKTILEESLQNTIPQNDTKGLKINITIGDKLKQEIISDPFRLQQILTNLLSNAYKFTSEGSISIEADLKKINNNPNTLKVKICDTGIGISSKNQKHIFEEFTQADETIEKQFGGYGLGLSITKKLTQLLGGTIYVDSELGKGTCFIFHYPVKLSDKKRNAPPAVSEKNKTPKLENKKILIVDDDPAQLALTSEIVSQTNVQTVTCMSVNEALTALRNKKFDLMLTDIQMPGEDGFSLLKKIKSNPETKTIPVIAISGKPNITAEDFLKKGFSASLPKPYKGTDLLELLNAHLETEVTYNQNATPIELSGSELFKLATISQFTQGDEASLKAILTTFVKSTEESIAELVTFADEKNQEQISRTAHRMLPMFRQLEIDPTILEQLEEQKIEVKALPKKLEDLQKQIGEVIAAINSYIKG